MAIENIQDGLSRVDFNGLEGGRQGEGGGHGTRMAAPTDAGRALGWRSCGLQETNNFPLEFTVAPAEGTGEESV